MQQMMGGAGVGGVGSNVGGVGGGTSGGQNPVETQQQAAERRYRVQLETLERMGFPDRSANIQGIACLRRFVNPLSLFPFLYYSVNELWW